MAKLHIEQRRRRNPSNPKLFGEDLNTAGIGAGGLFATAWLHTKFIGPMISGITGSGTVGRIIDGLATFGSAWLVGKGARMVASAHVADTAQLGGAFLAGGKTISAIIPGVSINPTVSYGSQIGNPIAGLLGGGTSNGSDKAPVVRVVSGI